MGSWQGGRASPPDASLLRCEPFACRERATATSCRFGWFRRWKLDLTRRQRHSLTIDSRSSSWTNSRPDCASFRLTPVKLSCNRAGVSCVALRDEAAIVAPRRAARATRPGRSDQGMASDIRIALDAMGGDHGPAIVVPAAAIALERRPDVEFLLYGDERTIGPSLRGIRGSPPGRAFFIPTSRSR